MQLKTICYILLFCVLQVIFFVSVSISEEKRYVNPEYMFLITFDTAKVAKAIEDHPPNPNHGVGLELVSGGYLYVGGGGENSADFFLSQVENCTAEDIKGAFKQLYTCNNSLKAGYLRILTDRIIFYEVVYDGVVDKEAKKLFLDILCAFKPLSSKSF